MQAWQRFKNWHLKRCTLEEMGVHVIDDPDNFKQYNEFVQGCGGLVYPLPNKILQSDLDKLNYAIAMHGKPLDINDRPLMHTSGRPSYQLKLTVEQLDNSDHIPESCKEVAHLLRNAFHNAGFDGNNMFFFRVDSVYPERPHAHGATAIANLSGDSTVIYKSPHWEISENAEDGPRSHIPESSISVIEWVQHSALNVNAGRLFKMRRASNRSRLNIIYGG